MDKWKEEHQIIHLNFYGTPIAQGRPKISTKNGLVRAIDPAKSRNYKKKLHDFAKALMTENKWEMFPKSVPLSVRITVVLPIPESWSNKQKSNAIKGDKLPTSRPDLSNYIKGIEDSLNGVTYEDDSSITTLIAQKIYGEEPLVYVNITKEDSYKPF